MKTWKKILALGLLAVMTAGLAAGCASKAGTNGNGSGAEKGEANGGGDSLEAGANGSSGSSKGQAAQGKKGGMPAVVWWTVGGTVPGDFDKDMDRINAYLEEKLHIRLDLKVAQWGDYQNKMNTIVNSGEYYDMMFVNSNNYSKYVNLGAFENITDRLQTDTPGLFKLIPEELWNGVRINGNIYSVPSYKDSSLTQFWCFDDQYVKKYNIDLSKIKTMQDLDGPFKEMKAGEGKSFYPLKLTQGGLLGGLFNTVYDGLAVGLEPLGVSYDDKERKVVCTLEQPKMQDRLKLLHQWYTEGIINPDANVLTENVKKLPFLSAQGWPSAVVSWQILSGVDKYDAIPVFGPMYSTETIQGGLNAVSVNSRHKDECLKLLQFLNTDHKFRDMMAYGVEGKDFAYAGDNVVKRLSDTWPLAAYTQGTFFDMSVTEGSDPDQWNEVKRQNEEAVSSSCLGFSLNISNIQQEMANCQQVWDKYKYDLETGATDPDEVLPQIIKELKNAGLDTVISEAQKQINEYFN